MPGHDGSGARQGYGLRVTFDKGLGKGLYKVAHAVVGPVPRRAVRRVVDRVSHR